MEIRRRTFVKSLSGAAAVAFVAARGIAGIAGSPADRMEVKRQVLDALAARLSHLDMAAPAVHDFAEALAARSVQERGSTVTSVAEALDPKYRAVSFERFVCQEFIATTNYLQQGDPAFEGLVFGRTLAEA